MSADGGSRAHGPAGPNASAGDPAAGLAELEREVITCRRCPRLVAWREEVARVKRASFSSEVYWGRPLPGFGDPGTSSISGLLAGRLNMPRNCWMSERLTSICPAIAIFCPLPLIPAAYNGVTS